MTQTALCPETAQTTPAVSAQEAAFFQREGYLIKRAVFGREEVNGLLDHFMRLHATRAIPNYPLPAEGQAVHDPLLRYPRVMHPHRWDERSLRWLIDPRVAAILSALLGEEPLATQSMFYFKPPGARGQALHQDNFYLRVRPKTCIAAWTALDPSDEENGGLRICPRTQDLELACPDRADANLSFATERVTPPPGCEPIPALLGPGDVLFFNGSVIHGSTPNHSATRFRRSFICHYAPASASEIARGYMPVLNMQGTRVELAAATGGGPCGSWQGRPAQEP